MIDAVVLTSPVVTSPVVTSPKLRDFGKTNVQRFCDVSEVVQKISDFVVDELSALDKGSILNNNLTNWKRF